MKLNTLKLTHFKNYRELSLDLAGGINCLFGKNGMGKTNLLDALHYLSMTRSAHNTADQQNILYGEGFFAIHGEFEGQKRLRVGCYFEAGKKKVVKVNGKELGKLSTHIGTLPSVLVTPDDTGIIREGSEVRRKLFDRVIAQHDSSYLEGLATMQHLLKQRNHFLKQNEGRQRMDQALLQVYDEKLLPVFGRLAETRRVFVEAFMPYFVANYRMIFGGEERPGILYQSECLEEDFEAMYRAALPKDRVLLRTTKGAHKDDYRFELNGRPIKKFGSQGQQKSFLIALKLAEYDYLRAIKQFNPMLLLDDIFDKLDDERIGRLVNLLTDEKRFSQIFITDARSERSQQFFSKARGVKFFHIDNGECHEQG